MGTMEIENISLDAVLVKHLLGKRINSRASVLELDGNGEFATQILLQVKNDRIASWDLDPYPETKLYEITDSRFQYITKKQLRSEYDILIYHCGINTTTYLNPFMARFVFIEGLTPENWQDALMKLADYGYTVLEKYQNVIYAQFLYRKTKYPHAKLSERFPYQHESVPKGIAAWMSHPEIAALQEEGKGKIYMEIGTYDGFSANMMAQVVEKLICIDSYDSAPGRLRQVMTNTIIPNRHKLVNITGFSQYVSWVFKEAFIDVLMIDGDHRYQAVISDYKLYRPLVKDGGVIAFHDYGNFPTVGIAVDTVVKDEFYKSVETLLMFKKKDSK